MSPRLRPAACATVLALLACGLVPSSAAASGASPAAASTVQGSAPTVATVPTIAKKDLYNIRFRNMCGMSGKLKNGEYSAKGRTGAVWLYKSLTRTGRVTPARRPGAVAVMACWKSGQRSSRMYVVVFDSARRVVRQLEVSKYFEAFSQ